MKKRILLISLTVSLGAIVLLATFMTAIFYSNLVENTNKHLSVYMLSYTQNKQKFLPYSDNSAQLLSQEVGGCRVTFIAEDGTVLGDSNGNSAQMDSHSSRKEVLDALAAGKGTAVRNSDTIGESLIYYCELFDQPEIEDFPIVLVRIAEKSSSVAGVLWQIFPLLAVFVVLDVALCFALSSFAVRHVLKPVEEFGKMALEENKLPFTAPYKELDMLAIILTQLKREELSRVEEIKAEKMRESVILDNMDHGIILLKSVDDVILINKTAAKILGYKEGERALFHMARDRELLKSVEEEKNTLLYRRYRGRDYAFRVTFVKAMAATVILITDVTELKRAEGTKNEFIANVTHEMNTPLTAISGFAQLIATGKLNGDQIAKNADIIVEQSRRLSLLIKSILDFSALEAEEVESSQFSLNDLVADVVQSYGAAAQAQGVSCKMISNADVSILGKKKHVKEIIENLVSNAVRYNVLGGSVSISIDGGAKPVVTVSDTGIGIEEKYLGRVFDRFFTADTSRNKGGFGLGLAIVKKLAAMCGYKVDLESTLGKGTSVTVRF